MSCGWLHHVCVCVCVCTLILLVFNVCASNTIHGQCLLLAPLVRGPQMVCVIVCMCVCVWTKCCMRYVGIYPHISSFRAMSAYTSKGNIHFYPHRLAVLKWFEDTLCAWACVHSTEWTDTWICQDKVCIKFILSTHTRTHTHTLTHILIPFEDCRLTGLKVDIAQTNMHTWILKPFEDSKPMG